jgi:hypothetical protein
MSATSEASCPSCGHVNSLDVRFCAECGAILPPPKNLPPSPKEPSPRETDEPPPAQATKRRGTILAAAVAIVVLTGILIAVQRRRDSGLIPVPGATPTEATATAAPVATAAAPPTPAATAPPRREHVQSGEPPLHTPTLHAEINERPRHTPASPAGGTQAQPRNADAAGWYRVRYRAPLFRDPNETSPVIAYLPAGAKVRVTRVLPGFLAVESVTGKPPGYLSSDDASPQSEP